MKRRTILKTMGLAILLSACGVHDSVSTVKDDRIDALRVRRLLEGEFQRVTLPGVTAGTVIAVPESVVLGVDPQFPQDLLVREVTVNVDGRVFGRAPVKSSSFAIRNMVVDRAQLAQYHLVIKNKPSIIPTLTLDKTDLSIALQDSHVTDARVTWTGETIVTDAVYHQGPFSARIRTTSHWAMRQGNLGQFLQELLVNGSPGSNAQKNDAQNAINTIVTLDAVAAKLNGATWDVGGNASVTVVDGAAELAQSRIAP